MSVAGQTIVEPASAREAADALVAARRDRLAVIPRGGGTKQDWGTPARRADVVLSTARMNRIVEHAWADLTVTVESGCAIAALQDALRVHGQRVAADPLWPARATVGGVLSTNDTGALRLRFGGWRDLVIGTTLAFPDGTVASSGGKVVKNVAGYDLSKLVTGAFGTLGVITQAIFRLHPLPARARTLTATVRGAAAMRPLVAAIQDSRLAHTALQVRSAAGAPIVVDILIEGSPGGVDAQVDELRRLPGADIFEDATPDVWHARESLWQEPGAILKVSTLTSRIHSVLEWLAQPASQIRGWAAVFQATGLGAVRCDVEPSAWPSALAALRATAARDDGSVVVLRPLAGTESCDVWGDPGDALPLMRAVKQQFDPDATLNPGRFVGGI